MVLDFAKEVMKNMDEAEFDKKRQKISNINKGLYPESWNNKEVDIFLLGYMLGMEEK